jgi:hypothetical protein
MMIKLSPKSILVVLAVVAVACVYMLKVKPFSKHAPDAATVAACQKKVEATYTSLVDTSSLVASATTSTIQKEEQDAKTACTTEH